MVPSCIKTIVEYWLHEIYNPFFPLGIVVIWVILLLETSVVIPNCPFVLFPVPHIVPSFINTIVVL